MGLFDRLFSRRRDSSGAKAGQVPPAPNQGTTHVGVPEAPPVEPVPDIEKPADEAPDLPYHPIVMDPNAIPAWAAREVIDNVDDPDVLAELALNAPLEDVRMAATRKITNQQVLLEVALHDHAADGMKRTTRPGNVKAVAAERLRNPAMLKRLALETTNGNLIYGRLGLLSQEDLAEVASSAKNHLSRRFALNEMTDERALADVAIAGGEMAKLALENMGDREQLRRVYDAVTDSWMRKKAIDKAGGYLCEGCGKEMWPEGDEVLPCVCPECGAENHSWEHVNNVTDYRDYSAGTRWDECRRCHMKKNYETVNVGGM